MMTPADERTREALTRFRHAYWQAFRGLDTVRLRQWERSRVTLPQLRVLYQVRRTPGITTVVLSRALGITVSTTSGLVGKLTERGLVDRLTAADRRQAPLRLTDEGAALVGELSDEGRTFLERVAAALGDDLETATVTLERVAAAAEAARRAESAPGEAETRGHRDTETRGRGDAGTWGSNGQSGRSEQSGPTPGLARRDDERARAQPRPAGIGGDRR